MKNSLATLTSSRFMSTLALAAICFASGCSDPADKVSKAPATDAVKTSDQAASSAAARNYVVRAESTIGFVASKVTGSHDGGFKKFSGDIKAADGKVVAAEIIIDMNTTWANNPKLTEHLKSADFFDVAKMPRATFTVTSIEPGTNGLQKVTGNLNLHGVTKSISFPADIKAGDDAVTVKAEFAINRKDFNVNYPGKPDDLIRDNVVLKLDIKATPGEPRPEDQLTATAAK
jgi:polyisoprenoid-binding protein YceI